MVQFIINPRGGVQSVNDGAYVPAGSRPATAEEITVWYRRQGLERPKPEPEPEPEEPPRGKRGTAPPPAPTPE